MKRASFGALVVVAFVLGCAVLVVAVPAEAQTHVVPPSKVKVVAVPAPDKVVSKAIINIDATDSCGDDDPAWSYICEAGVYHAWFAFDVSGIAPGTPLDSITFSAYMWNDHTGPVERSILYAADDSWVGGTCPGAAPADILVGTLTHPVGDAWETFDINMAAHDFTGDLADGIITFMVTGPTSGAHECGRIELIASGNVPYITVDAALAGVEVPTAGVFGLLLLVALLSTAGFILLRR